jgi:hypothetical protein
LPRTKIINICIINCKTNIFALKVYQNEKPQIKYQWVNKKLVICLLVNFSGKTLSYLKW